MNSSPLSVLVLDDEPDFAKECKGKLEAGSAAADIDVSVKAMSETDLDAIAEDLYERSRAFRGECDYSPQRHELDDCDLLFIDADLRDSPAVKLASGKDLAYSIRCFTEAGSIVVLNADGQNSFDLTLKGDRESFGDLHIGSDQLANPGIWKMPPQQRFRPWEWPLLWRETQLHKERMKRLLELPDFNLPIAQLLDASVADIEALSPDVASFLTTERVKDDTPLKDLTLLDFILRSEFALARKDAAVVAEDPTRYTREIARVATARLSKWVNRVLLPTQDVLVDAPHLALRFPSVLKGSSDQVDTFSKTICLDLGPEVSADDLGTLGFEDPNGELSRHRLKASIWSDRPLWWGRRLNDSELKEAKEPWLYEPPPFAFCEDASVFLPEDRAIAFSSTLETPYRLRYVAKDPDVVYRYPERFLSD